MNRVLSYSLQIEGGLLQLATEKNPKIYLSYVTPPLSPVQVDLATWVN